MNVMILMKHFIKFYCLNQWISQAIKVLHLLSRTMLNRTEGNILLMQYYQYCVKINLSYTTYTRIGSPRAASKCSKA